MSPAPQPTGVQRSQGHTVQAGLVHTPHFYFSIALLVTLGAFWPSFLSKLGSTDVAHLIHGITATLWMTVPIIQSWLISHKKFEVHRRLGWVTLVVLAPLLVVSGLHMVQLMVLRDKEFDLALLLEFAFLDLCALMLFVTFLVLAILNIRRNDSDAHARYMAGTVLFAIEPAVERVFVFYVPGVSGFGPALYLALIAMELIVLVLLYFEWQRHRVRLPFCLALGFFVAMHVFMTPVANSVAFRSFALWFAKL